MQRLEQMVIFHVDCSDHPCCLRLLGLLLALVPTIDSFLLCREWQCPILERKGFSIALNIKSNLGSAGIDNGSGSVQEWSS